MATGRIGVTPTLGTRWSKTFSGVSTSVSGLDDNSVSLVYSVGYEQVYRNGVLLSRGNDYTATTGNSITLIDATIAGDIIEVFANQLVPLTDAISKGQFTAKGALLSATAASTPAVLTVGSNDQVLTADSTTSTGLKWATPSSGGMTLLSTTTLSGASTTVSSISGSYTDLYIVVTGMRTAANSYGVHFDPNGSTSISSAARVQSIAGTGTAGGYDGATIWVNQSGDFLGSNSTNGFVIYIYDYASANPVKNFKAAMSWFNSSSQRVTSNHMGGIATTSAISSFTATTDASTFNAGTIKIYGVK